MITAIIFYFLLISSLAALAVINLLVQYREVAFFVFVKNNKNKFYDIIKCVCVCRIRLTRALAKENKIKGAKHSRAIQE